jgi:hypothetical protein
MAGEMSSEDDGADWCRAARLVTPFPEGTCQDKRLCARETVPSACQAPAVRLGAGENRDEGCRSLMRARITSPGRETCVRMCAVILSGRPAISGEA